ncbi:MAG: hypothetical protein WBX15_19095 [Thermoanaerobaculia bacterium]
MSALLVTAGAFGAILASFPYLVLRAPVRKPYALWDAASYAFVVALLLLRGALRVEIDPALALGIFVVVKLAGFAAFAVTAEESRNLRWSPLIAALLAGAVYLALIPSVLRYPLDGDEPYYVLIAESIRHDGDLDLANQYAEIAHSPVGRPNLGPQLGDPRGSHGEQYSRHEPFLPLLLVPGLTVAGIPGAVATIALFGALLVWSTLRWLEEEGVSRRAALLVWPFLAFGPPVIDYSLRIWPAVPAAFFFVQSVRAIRSRRTTAAGVWLLLLALLKLRLLLIAAPLALVLLARQRERWTRAAWTLPLLAIPFAVLWFSSGRPLGVHAAGELLPLVSTRYLIGMFGTLLDAQRGLLFQAPLWFAGALALLQWVRLPEGVKIGAIGVIPYLVVLFPRAEWHGGWAPPLRYIVFLVPLLAIASATVIEKLVRRGFFPWIALWTMGLTAYGIAYPFGLFHIENGESRFGEYLSHLYHADFSRLLPSFVRVNEAAVIASAILAAGVIIGALTRRREWRMEPKHSFSVAVAALVIAGGFRLGMQPAAVVQFEDAHVIREGGELYPKRWTVARFLYTGGWRLTPGSRLEFRFRSGSSLLWYSSDGDVTLDVDGKVVTLPPTDGRFLPFRIQVPAREEHSILAVSGEAIVDRIEHE